MKSTAELPNFDKPNNWIAEALIVAVALPDMHTTIDDCEIRPSQLTWSERQEPMPMEGSGPGIYSTLIPEPPHLRFSASHRVSTKILNQKFEAARKIAIQRFTRIASLTSLLTGYLGYPPDAAIRFAAMAPAQDPSNRVGDLVEARGGVMPIMPMDSGLISLVTEKYRAATLNPLLGRLIDVWYEADYRAGLAFTAEDRQDVVIRFTKILEGVANAMRPGKGSLRTAARAERETAVRSLSELLNRNPRLNAALDAIRIAHAVIRRTGLESEWARIELAGLALGLSRSEIALARRTYTKRNAEGLAHFGRGEVEGSDVDAARGAAHAYLTSYLRRRVTGPTGA